MKRKTIQKIQACIALGFFAWLLFVPFEVNIYNGITFWMALQAIIATAGTTWFGFCSGLLE